MSDLYTQQLEMELRFAVENGIKNAMKRTDKYLRELSDIKRGCGEWIAEHDAKARADAIEEYRKEMQDMIEGDEEFTDWQKHEILECNELVAEALKEQSNE